MSWKKSDDKDNDTRTKLFAIVATIIVFLSSFFQIKKNKSCTTDPICYVSDMKVALKGSVSFRTLNNAKLLLLHTSFFWDEKHCFSLFERPKKREEEHMNLAGSISWL